MTAFFCINLPDEFEDDKMMTKTTMLVNTGRVFHSL